MKTSQIKNISNASLNFNIHPTLFNIVQNNFIVDNIYSGQIEFSGSNKELNIDRFFLNNKFFDLNAEIKHNGSSVRGYRNKYYNK